METLLPIVGLLLGVLLVSTLSARWSLPVPIVLEVAGLAVLFVPGIPGYEIEPDLVLAGGDAGSTTPDELDGSRPG